MVSSATSAFLPPLGVPHEREGVGRELEVVLHELVNLSLIGNQLYWAVFGPLSRPIHLQLVGLVDSWRGLAERVRARLEPVGEVDLVSQNVLVEVVRKLEKQQWMLRIQLEESV